MMSLNTAASIEGVVISPLSIISDDRGSVLHMLRSDSESFTKFGECYFSEVFPGAVKAWKRHKVQTQNLSAPSGLIQLVIFDVRPDSKTFNNLLIIQTGRPDNYFRITIPPGLWYGFKCIGETPALLANCADFPHDKSESETLELHSNLIPHKWNETLTS